MTRSIIPFVLAFSLALPVVAAAQGRIPTEGSLAVAGNAGLFFPSDDVLESTPTVEGQIEFYMTPRLSVRFGLGWADPSLDFEDEDSLRQLRIGGDLIYNWERNAWHPYVGAGLGAHLVQFKDNGEDFGDGDTKLGIALLGGAEYFFGDRTSIKGEGRYQFAQDTDTGFDPSGFVLMGGIKQYF